MPVLSPGSKTCQSYLHSLKVVRNNDNVLLTDGDKKICLPMDGKAVLPIDIPCIPGASWQPSNATANQRDLTFQAIFTRHPSLFQMRLIERTLWDRPNYLLDLLEDASEDNPNVKRTEPIITTEIASECALSLESRQKLAKW